VDLFEDDGYEMLVRALRARANKIGATLQIKKTWQQNINSKTKIQTSKPNLEKVRNNNKSVSAQEEYVRTIDKRYLLGLIVLIVFFSFWIPSFFNRPKENPIETKTKEFETPILISVTETLKPSTPLSIPTNTKTPVFTVTLTPLPIEIKDDKGVSMVLVPGGNFIMGGGSKSNSQPAHTVFLDTFYVDKYEVTNKHYKLCVDEGICKLPSTMSSNTHSNYFGASQYGNYPVIYVDWYQALSYCEWREASLPTEAQWEKSARSTDGRSYPWGDEVVECNRANYCLDDTVEAGRFEAGKSVYGVYDMAGNVSEWVLDWYSDTYYQNFSTPNPSGPDNGVYKVLRGGSWDKDVFAVHTTYRIENYPSNATFYTGFRCARDANP
jgi:formylglycine-generating enzyme required for sulfatase activity